MTDQTPSQIIAAPKIVKVKDRRGRIIEIRKLNTLERMQLLELVGASNSANAQYLGLAALAYCVTSIDGNAVGRLGTKLALEAVVKELDDDGFDAIAEAVSENFMSAQKTDGEAKEALKNG